MCILHVIKLLNTETGTAVLVPKLIKCYRSTEIIRFESHTLFYSQSVYLFLQLYLLCVSNVVIFTDG